MNDYIVAHLGLDHAEAALLRQHYWRRYGATLLGLVRHHGVKASHFLEETHCQPGLEQRLCTSAYDRAALRRLRGRRFVLTNAPRAYTLRVLNTLKLADCFDGVISIEDMTMFGELRPKPDARLFRHIAARLKVRPAHCVLVEDVLVNQKAARRVGMRAVWMQRYLDGRFRGHLRGSTGSGFNLAHRVAAAAVDHGAGTATGSVAVREARIDSAAATAVDAPAGTAPPGSRAGVQRCPSPRYVHAKIRSLLTLLSL